MPRPEPLVADARLLELLQLAEGRAKEVADGHLTIMRFTTHWKATFGTPDLDAGYPDGREEVRRLTGYPTLHDALVALLS